MAAIQITKPAQVAQLMGLAPEGGRIVVALTAAAVLLAIFASPVMGLIVGVGAGFCAYFFRDPERQPPNRPGILVSGADGVVSAITDATLSAVEGVKFARVSVFMSPLNVHVNRAPVDGEVLAVEHTRGKFRAAFRDYASEHNERNSILIRDQNGLICAMVQIAGYLARRIVCRVSQNQRLKCGQRIGLIMFGSRVDHYVPPQYRLLVRVGQRVRAGETVLAELNQ